ncbi:type II toxin-antitoxin system HicB family antitoxin [Endozoicomonas gorgoniicola]|uniref:type II toxin-antitoxin system HicB family antitoxin n=1 Tax=Endozoicomonas gorgoniicola TaxID=1234144 RepID=UPI0038994B74
MEKTEDNDTAYGIVIPALCNDKYSAYSASDEFDDIVKNAKDAAFTVMEEMALNEELDLSQISLLNKPEFVS